MFFIIREKAGFPAEFMFQLSEEEFDYLRSQNAATNLNKRRSLPLVFTEHGVIMAAAILKSEIADRASVKVVEAFVAMRRFLAANAQVFQRLETIEYKLLESDQKFEDAGHCKTRFSVSGHRCQSVYQIPRSIPNH